MTTRTKEKTSILVIDDEPVVRDALRLVLEASGYDVVLADKGRNGLKQARKNHFNVIITDFCLPDISGLEVFKAIRNEGFEVLVIIITADDMREAFAEAQKLGAVGFLSKPFSPSDILELIPKP